MQSEVEIKARIKRARELIHKFDKRLAVGNILTGEYTQAVDVLEERIRTLQWVLETEVRDEDVEYL